jgi:type I restriction enzyme S subunit
VGAVSFSQSDFWPIDTCYYIARKREDDWRYLRALLEYLDLGRLNAATGVPGLSRRDALAIRGAFPSPEEQRAIATILESADAAIERTRDALRQAIRLQDGVLQELLTLGIGQEGRVRSISRDPRLFQPTDIGKMPTGWEISTVGVEFDIQTGFTLNVNRRPVLNRRKYLRVANVQRGRLDLTDVSELEAGEDEFQKRKLKEDDLLVVEGHADSMQIGRCAMVNKQAAGLTFQNHLYCLRPKRVEANFGCLWLNSTFAKRYWRRVCSTTSGLNTINQRKLKRMAFPVPPKKERERICELEASASSLVHTVQGKLSILLDLKRGLMQDLLTGKVRVPAVLEVARS